MNGTIMRDTYNSVYDALDPEQFETQYFKLCRHSVCKIRHTKEINLEAGLCRDHNARLHTFPCY